MQALNAAWGVIRPYAAPRAPTTHTQGVLSSTGLRSTRAAQPDVVRQPDVVAGQPEQPAAQPWSKAQVADWLGLKGWRFENDRRARKSRVRFARKREDLPRRTYDVVGMSVEMGEAVPDGMMMWVNKQ